MCTPIPTTSRVEARRRRRSTWLREDVVVATCTGGERGSILNPAMDRPDILANIADIRRQEMDRAREILGITQVWLGFVDSGLPEGDDPPPLPNGALPVPTSLSRRPR